MSLNKSLIISMVCLLTAVASAAPKPRVLKFSGVPKTQASSIQQKFPFVFQREVTLSEVDQVVRFLMQSGQYTSIEVVESYESNPPELILIATPLKKVSKIVVNGNKIFSADTIQDRLALQVGRTFERKNLLQAVEELKESYHQLGYINPSIQVSFQKDEGIGTIVQVDIAEGPATSVREINFESPNMALNKRMRAFAKSYIGRPLSEDFRNEFQNEALIRLREDRYIKSKLSSPSQAINADRSQAKLTYTIEQPWSFEFLFKGNDNISERELIQTLQLESYSGSTINLVPDFTEKVRKHYISNGYANVEIKANERVFDEQFLDQIYFVIDEGPRVQIARMEVIGKISRPQKYYIDLVERNSSSVIQSGYYSQADLNDALDKVVIELQNQGFLKARKLPFRVEYNKPKDRVVVSLNIDEGPLTQVRQVKFDGAKSFSSTQLLEAITVKPGQALSYQDLQVSQARLIEFYKSKGYLEAKLLNDDGSFPLVTFNDANTQATVQFRIDEGPKVVVGSVIIEGFSTTKEYVIKREVRFKDGDVLTPELIDDTIDRIQKLNLFASVTIRTLEDGTSISERTVVISVSEKNPGIVQVGMGVNNDRQATIRGYLGVTYRNLGGTGRAASLRIDPSYSLDPSISYLEYRVTLGYLEPYLWSPSSRGKVNLVREQKAESPTLNAGAKIVDESNQLSLIYERDITRNLRISFNAWNFSTHLRFDKDTKVEKLSLNIGKLGPLIEFDLRDNVLNPTRGSYSFLGLDYASPLLLSTSNSREDIHFVKLTGGFTYYKALLNRTDIVWANSVRSGYSANLSDRQPSGIPSEEVFILGGRSTIRGFDTSKPGDRIPNIYQLINGGLFSDFRQRSDSYYGLIKTELRFPIRRELGGAIFYDGGAVIINQPGLQMGDPYRHSAGFGIRYSIGGIPLVVDVGFNLNPHAYGPVRESDFATHLAIGNF